MYRSAQCTVQAWRASGYQENMRAERTGLPAAEVSSESTTSPSTRLLPWCSAVLDDSDHRCQRPN
eukprot:7504221-Lingulodinium_polyedra.AAC.1